MTLTPKSPACILYAAMNDCCTDEEAFSELSIRSEASIIRYTAAAKAVRDATLDEAANVLAEWMAMYGDKEIKHVPAKEWAGDAVRDCMEIIAELKDKSP